MNSSRLRGSYETPNNTICFEIFPKRKTVHLWGKESHQAKESEPNVFTFAEVRAGRDDYPELWQTVADVLDNINFEVTVNTN